MTATETRLRRRIARIVADSSTFDEADRALDAMADNAIKHEVLIDRIAEKALQARFGQSVRS